MDALYHIYGWAESTEQLNLLLAGLTVLLAVLAVLLAFQTLSYMRGRDLEVDTRNGWIEIHKAMINLHVQRSLVMLQQSQLGAYISGGTNQAEENIKGYTLASAQLRAQLDRLNDDPLVMSIAEFLDANKLTAQWQTTKYEQDFSDYIQQVAFKSRPGNLDRRADVMTATPPSIRDRLKDLNIKAYYLLVALSFVYRANSGSHWLKWAITLTAVVAVLPVQDYVKSTSHLEYLRLFKVISLLIALICTLCWIWTAAATPAPAN